MEQPPHGDLFTGFQRTFSPKHLAMVSLGDPECALDQRGRGLVTYCVTQAQGDMGLSFCKEESYSTKDRNSGNVKADSSIARRMA